MGKFTASLIRPRRHAKRRKELGQKKCFNKNLNRAFFVAISAYLLWHKAFKNFRYTEGYVCKFLKSFYHQHLSTPHPQKSLNSGKSFWKSRNLFTKRFLVEKARNRRWIKTVPRT
jgi:hypothetical protein